jgi:predicted acetyltransferase
MELRRLDREDFDEYFDVRRQAYGANEDQREPWMARAFAHPGIVSFGVYDGALLGALRVIPCGQYLGGRSVPTGLVGGVVVRPEARGRGVARALLDAALDHMRDEGLVASALHPATTRVYRRRGWELAGRSGWAVVPTRSLAAIAAPAGRVDLVRLGNSDRAEIRALWSRYAGQVQGALDRQGWWDVRECEDDAIGTYRYGVRVGGELRGYLRYRQIEGRRWGYDITVDDFAALDGDAAMTLWRFLGAHAMQVPEVRVHSAAVGNLLLVLDEQDVVVDEVNRWMHRVVDLAGFLGARGARSGVSGSIDVTVTDPWPGGIDGTWTIEADDGRARATRRAEPGPADAEAAGLRTDVGALSALMVGRFDGADLVRAGRLFGDPEAVERLSALFAGPRPVMTDEF